MKERKSRKGSLNKEMFLIEINAPASISTSIFNQKRDRTRAWTEKDPRIEKVYFHENRVGMGDIYFWLDKFCHITRCVQSVCGYTWGVGEFLSLK
ncbi:hypothetical protein AM500_23220 [Bacillus sp. FJAT-18017]|uniref:hypothetical protein n=1 Tax=Bacillus sp. FJAT-18017 TaxID=1705566 RepID=UPI0006AE78C9|nr:hypothetical protein [Bacillus sp. FJAT-18017]ALC92355.1 hypothetical protein AM500_23220 [Bacillus sp. FJAT-18017]